MTDPDDTTTNADTPTPILEDLRPWIRLRRLGADEPDAALMESQQVLDAVTTGLKRHFPPERGYAIAAEAVGPMSRHYEVTRRRARITVDMHGGPTVDWVPYARRNERVIALRVACELDRSLGAVRGTLEAMGCVSVLIATTAACILAAFSAAWTLNLDVPPITVLFLVPAAVALIYVIALMYNANEWLINRIMRGRYDERRYDEDFIEIMEDWHAFSAELQGALPAWMAETASMD